MKSQHETSLSSLQSRLAPKENSVRAIASGLNVVLLKDEELQRVTGGRRASFGATSPTCSGGCEDDCGYDH